jgi:hypothetical protein
MSFEGQKNKTIVAIYLASKKMGSQPHYYYNLPYLKTSILEKLRLFSLFHWGNFIRSPTKMERSTKFEICKERETRVETKNN